MMSSCLDCRYAQAERAGMLIGEGWVLMDADRQASNERCAAHREEESNVMELKITVQQWVKDAKQAGEFVGWPRTLAGPYRFGFDGSREVVIGKYERWLFAEVKAKGRAWLKLTELIKVAREQDGLTLVCVEPEFGKVIGRCLQWMENERKDVA